MISLYKKQRESVWIIIKNTSKYLSFTFNIKQYNMILSIIIVIVNSMNSSTIFCPKGCATKCLTNNTCGRCMVGYDNDNSCMTCEWYNRNLHMTSVYIKKDTKCTRFNSLILKDSWLPPEKFITEIKIDEKVVFDIDESSDIDTSFCYYKDRYRFGKWFKLLYNIKNSSHILFEFSQLNVDKSLVNIDVTNSLKKQRGDCYAHTTSESKTNSKQLYVPVFSPYNNDPKRNTEDFYFYIFIHLGQLSKAKIELKTQVQNSRIFPPRFNLTLKDTMYLSEHPGKFILWNVPFEEHGAFAQPICFPTYRMKYIAFDIEFVETGKLVIDATGSGKMNNLQEYDIVNGDKTTLKCIQSWSGRRHGVFSENEKAGAFVSISANEKVKRHFAFISENQRINFVVKFYVICHENCNYKHGFGTCLPTIGKCKCIKGYGGSNCHKLCYYDNTWQISPNDNLCFFGSERCNEYCRCEEGTVLVNHRCLSKECARGEIGINDECYPNSEGCTPTCKCDSSRGFYMSSTKRCLSKLCGNGKKNTYYDYNGNIIRTEECDNGTNCQKDCRCIDGFITDPKSENDCIHKGLSVDFTIFVVIVSCVFVPAFVMAFAMLIFFITRYKKTNIEVFKEQQPTYYFYISGSINKKLANESLYFIDPITLDFGNGTEATEINDTHFQQIQVKNKSRNKYMMVIFHTPNTPKYVFHFDPQVVIMRPRASSCVTCYMTLYCTTKLRGMKIPYTVWFSKSKIIFSEIALLLKDKTFETWTNVQQKKLEKISKTVHNRFHHYLTISTDAASSTHIDMDELSISEKPIAEGAMGRVYMGSYRSVAVAVKQFRWEKLDEDEVAELKKNVVAECEMMAKLRNPFIASYIGSVTYIPQVSMVIQFFILGSLGEYLRQEKEDYVKMPYKLKVRMLFDTSRGMQFLHENRIMHLDLKPDNLLVNSLDCNSACTIKITDFGTSRFKKKSITNSEDKGLGTPIYAAPETFKDEYTFAGDVYSFAITAWELYYQVEPYAQLKSIFDIKRHVEEGKRLSFDQNIPPLYRKLVEECWRADPKDRPNFDKVTAKLVKVDEEDSQQFYLNIQNEMDNLNLIIEKRSERVKRSLHEIS
ncbi:serine-threonine protein kinase, putative [Entamoeba invadens IP1]|uniref:Serine-threonine protein kinase, putative n=1 Tax=Entamoeba invadens IP1 TaxID=370355 RepID=A0A0A1UFS1_ENTIV|nr:serine-threonine protein kinase, putative [Entamoeba invadens IP1]ELP91874.1 serine-threonine protein kinase, putative [Entamoeba invadens IP1]|eukprot:XP_004258645.1 serine-threonine protein kinase, putative [Entamoeba invadens IP1]